MSERKKEGGKLGEKEREKESHEREEKRRRREQRRRGRKRKNIYYGVKLNILKKNSYKHIQTKI